MYDNISLYSITLLFSMRHYITKSFFSVCCSSYTSFDVKCILLVYYIAKYIVFNYFISGYLGYAHEYPSLGLR